MDQLFKNLLGKSYGGFRSRRKLSLAIAGGPKSVGKPLSKLIWSGKWRHMRHQDHRFTFTREEGRISSMAFDGREIARSVPLRKLIGTMDRPVTIAASGPSALDYDWETLRTSGRKVIGLTGGASFLREKGIIPDLLVVTDPDFCKTGGFHVRDAAGVPLAIEYRAAIILETFFPGSLSGRPLCILERVNRWYGVPTLDEAELTVLNQRSDRPFHITESEDRLKRIGWSYQPDVGFYPSSTVAFVALELLIAQGATDVEIVGMDLGGTHSIYANARPSRLQEQYHDVILPSFLSMKVALESREIRIKNLSPTCPLPTDVFQFTPSQVDEREGAELGEL